MTTSKGPMHMQSETSARTSRPGQSEFEDLTILDDFQMQERGKDLLRFSTAGSVDDGKSTLIGRLLYDTQNVYEDQLRSVRNRGTTLPGLLDLALLTDGLRAEREQGITIDVAYRYFDTVRRKFIVADTPGHVQYTRNMVTGASTANAAIILVDARKGVLAQSRRHAYVASLLGVRSLIVAVNKMDLVEWSESAFLRTVGEFRTFFTSIHSNGSEDRQVDFIPVSALHGDNIVHASHNMPWYIGPTLIGLLEVVPASFSASEARFRMAVQRVIRAEHDFRGFAGQIARGSISVGDGIVALPAGIQSRVKRIVTFDGDLARATAPLSITLILENEIDISRGDMISSAEFPPTVTSDFTASLVWMDAQPLECERRYLLKHTSRSVLAQVHKVLAIEEFDDQPKSKPKMSGGVATEQQLDLNSIATVAIHAFQPLALDRYTDDRQTGSLVLIDLETNATVAAGMVRQLIATPFPYLRWTDPSGSVTKEERIARFGHKDAHLHAMGTREFVDALERALFDVNAIVVQASKPSPDLINSLRDTGLIVLSSGPSLSSTFVLTIDDTQSYLLSSAVPFEAAQEALHLLHERGLLGKGMSIPLYRTSPL